MLYKSSHIDIYLYNYILSPIEYGHWITCMYFYYELFLGYLHGHHKNIPFNFPMSFLYIFIKTGRQTYNTLFMKPLRNVHQCKIFLYTQVIHYNIANQMDLLCNVEFFFPQSKNLSHWFQFTKTSKQIKKKESFKCNPFQA